MSAGSFAEESSAMRQLRWIQLLVLLLASGGTLGAQTTAGVAGLPARVIDVLPFADPKLAPVTGMPEVTAAVFGPQENLQSCPNGRLIFGSGGAHTGSGTRGAFVATSGLSGQNPQVQDLSPLMGESAPHVIADNHLVRSGNDLFYTVEGVTWKPLPCLQKTPATCEKAWWNFFAEYPAKDKNTPGARSAIWVFHSSDCGSTWSLRSTIDAATLTVKDPDGKTVDGFCGVPRRWQEVACVPGSNQNLKTCSTQITRKWAEVGGWDGHYLAVNPETGRLVISTLCAYGTGVSERAAKDASNVLQDNDHRMHIFLVSDDDGKEWKSKVSTQPAVWRGPVMPLNDDAWLFVNRKDGKVMLLVDDPLTGTFSMDEAIEVADFQGVTATEPKPWKLRAHHGVVGRDLAINWVPTLLGKPNPPKPVMKPFAQVASYTWEEGKVLRFQIHSVDLDDGSSKVLTAPIRAKRAQDSVAEGSFIQGQRASLFYWLEERENNKFRVRYQVYSQDKPMLRTLGFQAPGTIRDAGGKEHEFEGAGTDDSAPFQGDYVKGAHYLSEKETEHFFLVWNENGTLAFAEVRVIGLTDSPM